LFNWSGVQQILDELGAFRTRHDGSGIECAVSPSAQQTGRPRLLNRFQSPGADPILIPERFVCHRRRPAGDRGQRPDQDDRRFLSGHRIVRRKDGRAFSLHNATLHRLPPPLPHTTRRPVHSELFPVCVSYTSFVINGGSVTVLLSGPSKNSGSRLPSQYRMKLTGEILIR